jgi:hypothetical protein
MTDHDRMDAHLSQMRARVIVRLAAERYPLMARDDDNDCADYDELLASPCGPSDEDRRLAAEHDELVMILGEYDPAEDCLEVL